MATVEFFSETFELNESVSADALADFAAAASTTKDSQTLSMESVITMRVMVWDCIAPTDLDRFKAVSKKHRASYDDWIEVFKATMEQKTERPTGQPSDSSAGPASIALKSVSVSEDKGSQLMDGRPDLQLAVKHMRRTG